MLRLLAVCGLLTIAVTLDFGQYDESAYESLLKEQGFSEEDVQQHLQEYRDAREELVIELDDDEEEETVHWKVAKGYNECKEFKTPEHGYHEDKKDCIGCLKPKSLAEICDDYECPSMEGVGIPGSCGFTARTMLSANWAVTPIDISDRKKGKTEAYWRLFKYINKANEQGVRIAKSAYMINRWFLDYNRKVVSAEMALYIPSAFQDNPPKPTNDKVTVETWGDAVTYNRAFGGDQTNNPDAVKKHFKLLRKALAEENITYSPNLKITFEFVKPGCGSQRTEVMLVDAESSW